MRILVISTFYPPVAFGGYEEECSGVVERLREEHEVLVLTASHGAREVGRESGVWRALPFLTPDLRGSLRSPAAAAYGARIARSVLRWRPDLVYIWNGSEIPQSTLRVIADSGLPIAVRVCQQWFGHLFTGDQFMRELIPAQRNPIRATWAGFCRGVNRLSELRLDPLATVDAAVSWNSAATARMAAPPPFVRVVLEEMQHPVPRWGDTFASVTRQQDSGREIVFVGRVTRFKGVQVAIEALARLRGGPVPDARLTIIGPEDRDYANQVRRRAADLGVGEAVSWLGPLSADQIASVLARASALIVPSIWDEPFGLVTIEGALARVPVVAADVGGIAEGVRHEEHALLFARSDPDGAARALARVFSEPEETRRRVVRARAHAEQYRLGPYLDRQAGFVRRAYEALTADR